MRRSIRLTGLGLAVLVGLGSSACGAARPGDDFSKIDRRGRLSSGPAVRVRWTKPLAKEWGGLYVPVERARAALDPANDRIFVGSNEKVLWAFEATGRPLYQYRVESGIDAAPTLDSARDELYLPTAAGQVHALRASSGELRWKAELSGAISQNGMLTKDALYVVTDDDAVFALARKDGSILWRYKREPRAGLKVGGHAGILLTKERLVTGFGDGSLVALSPGDGRVLWVIDTTLDFADPATAELGFVDVDTTPIQVGEVIYAASFMGGFYGVAASDGAAVIRQADLTGITSIAAEENTLVIASADYGVLCIELPNYNTRWIRDTKPYVASTVQIDRHMVYLTETRGALVALDLADGSELGRLQTEHGFLAAPSMLDGRGFILGNAGVLYAFDY